MITKTVAQLDSLLKPRGFLRQKTTWNRGDGSIVEAVDVQVSKAGDALTINAGVMDKDVYKKFWGTESPAFVECPMCTVCVRVGDLLDGKDKWWQLKDDRGVTDLIEKTELRILPFLEGLHSREAMAIWLIDAGVAQQRYPAPIINLAILKSLSGDLAHACELLTKLQEKLIGAWRLRATEVAERLGCR